jgi:hypothetical protein
MRKFNTTDYAKYLPAVNDYAKGVLQEMKTGRSFPVSITQEDLIFWEKGNNLFHYPCILHSAGLHKVGSWPNNAVYRSNKEDVLIFGDSGGYQIGTGTMKGITSFDDKMNSAEALERWDTIADKVRNWVTSLSESMTTHAITLDIPLWLIHDASTKSAFKDCTFEQLTKLTVENLHYLEANRTGKTKWHNVVHGITTEEFEHWWEAIKQFKFDGWALAGGAGADGGLYQMLYTILRMREDDAFEEGRTSLHVLGVSTLKWAVFFTAIQNALREQYGSFNVTYDSSSPFVMAAEHNKAYISPELGDSLSSWRISAAKVEQGFSHRGSTENFPYNNSPIGKLLTLGDLNVQGSETAKVHFDSMSRYLIANHNVWVMLDAIERANKAAFDDSSQKRVPENFSKCIRLIDQAFKADDWRAYLIANKKFFDEVTPCAYATEVQEVQGAE